MSVSLPPLDYFQRLDPRLRGLALLAMLPFAALATVIALVLPIALVSLAWQGDWKTTKVLFFSWLGSTGVALGFDWLVWRLWRAQSANGVTVLPTWLIRGFLIFFLGPLTVLIVVGCSVNAYQAFLANNFRVAWWLVLAIASTLLAYGKALQLALRLQDRPEPSAEEPLTETPDDTPRP